MTKTESTIQQSTQISDKSNVSSGNIKLKTLRNNKILKRHVKQALVLLVTVTTHHITFLGSHQ